MASQIETRDSPPVAAPGSRCVISCDDSAIRIPKLPA
jgi:hypothetical protein